MLKSYIGRLILIYGVTVVLIIPILYTYYDNRLTQYQHDLEATVIPIDTVTPIESDRVINDVTEPVSSLPTQPTVRITSADLFYEMIIAGTIILLTGFISTTFIAWKIHKKIYTINKTTNEIITNRHLGHRIPRGAGRNEFDQLAENLNLMLDTIESKVDDVKQISNNIAHDLRTPLTVLRTRLDMLAIDDSIRNELNRHVDQIVETFDALLRIGQLESANTASVSSDVSINILAQDVVDLFNPLADERGQTLSNKPTDITVKGDANLLFQALTNLLENAIKYAPINSNIEISSQSLDCWNEIIVKDSGGGIPEDKLEHVVKHFVRLDESRGAPGSGLGLSMVRAIAEFHHGQLILENRVDGFAAIIKLPKEKL